MATDLLARAPSDLEDNATEKFRSGEPIDDLASLIDRRHDSVVGRMDEQPDSLLELAANCGSLESLNWRCQISYVHLRTSRPFLADNSRSTVQKGGISTNSTKSSSRLGFGLDDTGRFGG